LQYLIAYNHHSSHSINDNTDVIIKHYDASNNDEVPKLFV